MFFFLFNILFHVFTDLFSQHLDVELSEKEVQTITSDGKAKTQITVLHQRLWQSVHVLV